MSLSQVSKPTIYKWMKLGLPHFYIGKLLFFKQEKVEEWMQKNGKNIKKWI
jgi:predicted DNA-binding transcriptional regulator AlpA